MANIVKEVEVDGVKHSITLADDMVGQGLKKDENGAVTLQTSPSSLNGEIGIAMSTATNTLVLQYGTGLKQASSGRLSLNYGTGIKVGDEGDIYVDSENSVVTAEAGRTLSIESNELKIGTDTNPNSPGIFSIIWEGDMKGTELRISTEDAYLYLEDGTVLLGGLTLSTTVKGVHFANKIGDAKNEYGVLNIILREGSDILFQTQDSSGNTYQGSVALSKK